MQITATVHIKCLFFSSSFTPHWLHERTNRNSLLLFGHRDALLKQTGCELFLYLLTFTSQSGDLNWWPFIYASTLSLTSGRGRHRLSSVSLCRESINSVLLSVVLNESGVIYLPDIVSPQWSLIVVIFCLSCTHLLHFFPSWKRDPSVAFPEVSSFFPH